MSKLTPIEIKNLTKLANLSPSLQIETELEKTMPKVIALVSKIQSLDTANVPETNQVTGLKNVLREDKIDQKRVLSQKSVLGLAEAHYQGFIVYPDLKDL